MEACWWLLSDRNYISRIGFVSSSISLFWFFSSGTIVERIRGIKSITPISIFYRLFVLIRFLHMSRRLRQRAVHSSITEYFQVFFNHFWTSFQRLFASSKPWYFSMKKFKKLGNLSNSIYRHLKNRSHNFHRLRVSKSTNATKQEMKLTHNEPKWSSVLLNSSFQCKN